MAAPDPSPTAPSPPQSPPGLGAATARAAALLTGNGPQAIDDQAAKLRELVDGATQRVRPATTRTPA
jgi:hypothetical protein